MGRTIYIFNSGRLKRKDNTLYFETEENKKPLPVENIESIYFFGEVDLNTKAVNFLAQNNITLHFFNYYGFYTGSFMPRDYLNSGFLLVKQVEHYLDLEKRMTIAREIVETASDNILRNLNYYKNRGYRVESEISGIESLKKEIKRAKDPEELMAIEGNIRQYYYRAFPLITGYEMEKRVKRPPDNILNTLISFGNTVFYTTVLAQIYHTQLNPTISYLHEPGQRRFSLALDLSEIFKPIIVDRVIFTVLNRNIITEDDFEIEEGYCFLKEKGKKAFLQEYEEKLRSTIEHRNLKRHVSYQTLIKLEAYRLIKHLIGDENYRGFRAWW
ncbi:subtype I-B CRISPR-associated endonuclease Cas1 [Carboxydothermus islandicus]|uniref:CRISPR-associated endonuclease Cas1 n=1 Tax=Carboxydothermus islandicus TaxID=661089 RepID=A0A1L8CZI0_9THEO|nr:type I-B CRISPR-associated endonuclease Cas1b [Carboxydothermus islandicus]GAV24269.1 subtype I-B CRISPR-associated endonuclease Cas1 [Carboxydothermus islandicus]